MTTKLMCEKEFLAAHGLEWGGISNPCLFQGEKLLGSISRSSAHDTFGQFVWGFGATESGICKTLGLAKEELYKRVPVGG